MLRASGHKFLMQVVIELSEEILAYSFSILRFAKLLNARRVDIFEFHFGLDGKEQKLNSTYQKGVSDFPLHLIIPDSEGSQSDDKCFYGLQRFPHS